MINLLFVLLVAAFSIVSLKRIVDGCTALAIKAFCLCEDSDEHSDFGEKMNAVINEYNSHYQDAYDYLVEYSPKHGQCMLDGKSVNTKLEIAVLLITPIYAVIAIIGFIF